MNFFNHWKSTKTKCQNQSIMVTFKNADSLLIELIKTLKWGHKIMHKARQNNYLLHPLLYCHDCKSTLKEGQDKNHRKILLYDRKKSKLEQVQNILKM